MRFMIINPWNLPKKIINKQRPRVFLYLSPLCVSWYFVLRNRSILEEYFMITKMLNLYTNLYFQISMINYLWSPSEWKFFFYRFFYNHLVDLRSKAVLFKSLLYYTHYLFLSINKRFYLLAGNAKPCRKTVIVMCRGNRYKQSSFP